MNFYVTYVFVAVTCSHCFRKEHGMEIAFLINVYVMNFVVDFEQLR